jgi:hypothetical protein
MTEAGQPSALQTGYRITEEDLEASKPAVRALLVSRLEQLWRPVAVALKDDEEGFRPIDARTQEIGLRICREMALLYRMEKGPPLGHSDDEQPMGEAVDRYALVEAKISEIEQKVRAQSTT